MRLDNDELRVELARRKLTQLNLAQALGLKVTTLTSWIRGAHPAPDDLPDRIERLLGLPRGQLVAKPLDGLAHVLPQPVTWRRGRPK